MVAVARHRPQRVPDVAPPVIDVDGPGGQPPAPAPIFCSGQSHLPNGEVLVAGGNLIYGETFHDDATPSSPACRRSTPSTPSARPGRSSPTWQMGAGTRPRPCSRTAARSSAAAQRRAARRSPERQLEIFNPPSTLGGQGTVEQNPSTDSTDRAACISTRTCSPSATTCSWPARARPVAILDTASFTWNGHPHLSRNRQYGNAVRRPGGPSGSDAFTTLGGYDTPAPRQLVPSRHRDHRDDQRRRRSPPGRRRAAERRSGELEHRAAPRRLDGPGRRRQRLHAGRRRRLCHLRRRPRRQVEVYDPTTDSWTLGPAQEEDRAYHSTAVLLPDGRVLSAGDDLIPWSRTERTAAPTTAEIYSPPYLFKGPRPVIDSAPQAVGWGDAFGIPSNSADIERAVLMAPAATTHGFDTHQRHVELKVLDTRRRGLDVVAPPSAPSRHPATTCSS